MITLTRRSVLLGSLAAVYLFSTGIVRRVRALEGNAESLARGEPLGTLLIAENRPLSARKQWIADHLQVSGRLILDAGAVQALADGKSLLPVGVVEVQGDFERGAAVVCLSLEGKEVARGLVNYGSGDARRIARHGSADIERLLGYVDEPEIIHRDNLTRC